MKLTAFTQIIVTLAVTAWVFILPVEAVATILVLELALLLYIKHDKMTMAAIGGLAVFTGMMVLLQLLFGSPLDVSLIGGLRMLVMTMAFLLLNLLQLLLFLLLHIFLVLNHILISELTFLGLLSRL